MIYHENMVIYNQYITMKKWHTMINIYITIYTHLMTPIRVMVYIHIYNGDNIMRIELYSINW